MVVVGLPLNAVVYLNGLSEIKLRFVCFCVCLLFLCLFVVGLLFLLCVSVFFCCCLGLLFVCLFYLGRGGGVGVCVCMLGQVRSECLTCTFRASCCSARLSRAQVQAFPGSSVRDRRGVVVIF